MTIKRTAMITGASAGLGLEFARQLAAQGYNLVLVARRKDKLEAVAESLQREFGIKATPLPADLSKPESPEQLFSKLASEHITIDYLVNNAGDAGTDLLLDREWADHQAFFELMLLSIAHLCNLFLPGMRERGYGRVINIASVAGRIPRSGGCNYGPVKAYLVALSEDLALTMKGTGVNVCALCPGFTHTDFHSSAGLQEMKDGMPSWMWYAADGVVADGIKAVEKGKPICISGRLYRWLDPLMQSVFTRWMFRLSAGH